MKQETESRAPEGWYVGSHGVFDDGTFPDNDYLINLEHGCWMPLRLPDYFEASLKEFFHYYSRDIHFFGSPPPEDEIQQLLIGAWMQLAFLPEFDARVHVDRLKTIERASNGIEYPPITNVVDEVPLLPSEDWSPPIADINEGLPY